MIVNSIDVDDDPGVKILDSIFVVNDTHYVFIDSYEDSYSFIDKQKVHPLIDLVTVFSVLLPRIDRFFVLIEGIIKVYLKGFLVYPKMVFREIIIRVLFLTRDLLFVEVIVLIVSVFFILGDWPYERDIAVDIDFAI